MYQAIIVKAYEKRTAENVFLTYEIMLKITISIIASKFVYFQKTKRKT